MWNCYHATLRKPQIAMIQSLKNIAAFDEVLRRPRILYPRLRKFLADSERWGCDQLESWLEKRLHVVLTAAQGLPAYTHRASAEKFSQWPALVKSDVANHENDFVRKGVLPSYRASTGGTTGVPLKLRRSLISVVMEQATIDHICTKAGLDLPRAKLAVLRGDFIKPPSDMSPPHWKSITNRKMVFSSFHLSRSTIGAYISALRTFAPDVIWCYPSSLQQLIGLIQESEQHIRVPFILSSSERLTNDTVAAARRILGSRVIDYYGQAERVAFAYAMDDGGYRFIPIYGVPELVQNSEDNARIRGTSLWNLRQIFVRYETGDLALVDGEGMKHRREVELGLRAFSGIDGRTSERIDLPDGRRVIGLNHIPRGVPKIVSVQLRHTEPNTVEAYVVPLDGFGPEAELVLRRNFYAKFPSNIDLHIRKVLAPVRTSSGKAPLLLPGSIVTPPTQAT